VNNRLSADRCQRVSSGYLANLTSQSGVRGFLADTAWMNDTRLIAADALIRPLPGGTLTLLDVTFMLG
jgi:hypothetical protein